MKELLKVRSYLAEKPRDLLLFELVLQTHVPVQTLLGLHVRDLRGLHVGDEISFENSEKRSVAPQYVSVAVLDAYHKFLTNNSLTDDDYLFKSQKGDRALSLQSVSRIVRKWLQETEVSGVYGLPGLRQLKRKEELGNTPGGLQDEVRLPKVKSKTMQERVYQELEKAILSGEIRPGHKLVTEEVARMMDVRRIPVREAMGRLEARGFITTRPKWGSVVNELSRQNLQEISKIRLLLEPGAAADATRNVTPAFLRNLEQAQASYVVARQAGDMRAMLESNRRFHFALYQQADSPIQLEIIKQLWDKVSPYHHIMFGQAMMKFRTIGDDFHENVVNGCKNDDPKEVSLWIETDICDATECVLKLFDLYKM